MSTQGNYVSASPPCPAPMTRAALLALRAAGQLRTECHYIVTDGPVIGTAGNTSPTQIELHAMSATSLGQEAKVSTTFDNTAWTGFYDIDLGTAGSLVYLVDPWNNRVSDPDADSPTVHTQFPWHAGGVNLRDNQINDSVLTGWSAALSAGGSVNDNEIRNSAVDLTGRTGVTSRFDRNRLSLSTVVLAVPTSFFDQNNIDQGQISHLGTGAGSFSFQNNTMLTGSFSVDATTTSQVTANSNVFGGTSGGYRVQVTGKNTALFIFSGNRAFNTGIGAQEMLARGAGQISVRGNTLNSTNLDIDGPGPTDIVANTISGGSLTQGAGVVGPLTIDGCDLTGAITVAGTGAGGYIMTQCYARGSTLTLTTSSTGLLTVRTTTMTGSTVTFSASGAAAPVCERGRLLGTTLDTAGFSIDTYDIVGGVKTLTASQTDRVRNGLGTNLI